MLGKKASPESKHTFNHNSHFTKAIVSNAMLAGGKTATKGIWGEIREKYDLDIRKLLFS